MQDKSDAASAQSRNLAERELVNTGMKTIDIFAADARRLRTLVEKAPPPRPDPRLDPAFARWFEGSKVVDAKGRPLLCFHGTHHDIRSFHPGTHFGTYKAANQRVGSKAKGGKDRPGANSIPVYLCIRNPLRLEDLEAEDEATLLSHAFGNKLPIDLGMARREGSYKALLAAGYDGIVYTNHVEDSGKDSYMIFRASQAKSAVSNAGSYSPESDSIMEADAESERVALRASHPVDTIPANKLPMTDPGVRGLPVIAESLTDWSGKWVHYTNHPKLMLNRNPPHPDPVGIYLFAADFKPLPVWRAKRFRFDVRLKQAPVLDVANITHDQIERFVDAMGIRVLYDDAMERNPRSDPVERFDAAWTLLAQRNKLKDYLEHLPRVKPEHHALMAMTAADWNKRIRAAGWDAIHDDTGSILANEPQLLVLDPRIIASATMVEQDIPAA
ncbi:MAG: hypothetical protein ACRYGR_05970 [Janthinobacterium lividum]